ncbi:MAG: sulfotransferase domain-containing protein, partial [Anaerolineae bacterium]|nr:sulfotransferase domain-containing protein [Anaerolineae bacterium]
PMLPNLLIIGVARGGTTTLYESLRTHPAICTPPVTKEIRYFYPAAAGEPLPPLADYARHFSHCQPHSRYRMEASPEYYAGGAPVAAAMRERLGADLKLLCILREPVARFISMWRYLIAQMFLEKTLSLRTYLERCQAAPTVRLLDYYNALETGKYVRFLPTWLDHFGDNLKILFLDDLPDLTGVAAWLDLPASGFAPPAEALNQTRGYKYAALHRAVLAVRKRGKPVFERSTLIRRFFKHVYYALNGDSQPPAADADVVSELRRIYAPHNHALADLLREHTSLPPWLAEA